jgi:hypothetical protein
VRYLCEFIGLIRVLECSFGVPFSPFGVTFFIVFRGGAMRACRKFMPFGGLPVCFVHGIHRFAATAASWTSAPASVDAAISWAPVCFNRSLARTILSDVSQ